MQNVDQRVLLVEDEPAHVEAVRHALHPAGLNGSIQVAGTLREYRELVAAQPPEIAIVDLNLPDGRALEVLTSPPEAGAFPVVVMTGHGNEEVAVETLKAGALDYVVKSPKAFAGMPRTVERALREWDLLQERKRAEEALRRRAEELARSNVELDLFSRVVSHNLKEPLRMVSSYTQLLATRYQGKLGADADEFIAYAADGAVRMQQLIDDLLAYAQASARQRQFQTISSETALSTALQNLAAAIQESEAVIRSGPLPEVCADPVQLGQMFQNLLGNAIKFRKSAAPRIDVACEEDPDEWRFSVGDDGIGIDPESADRIFQLFQRLHTRQEYPGTGIGLAICKKIAEEHGGRIWVTSQTGQGATFQFTIRKKLAEPQ